MFFSEGGPKLTQGIPKMGPGKFTLASLPLKWALVVLFLGGPIFTRQRVCIYTLRPVKESLYNRLFIGHQKSAANQAVSTTLPEGCSSGYVHWFPV